MTQHPGVQMERQGEEQNWRHNARVFTGLSICTLC